MLILDYIYTYICTYVFMWIEIYIYMYIYICNALAITYELKFMCDSDSLSVLSI